MKRKVGDLNGIFDRWLRAPEPHAAGRMSLYRIVYGLFFLFTLPTVSNYMRYFADLPTSEWQPIDSIAWFNPPPPNPVLFQIMPLTLAFCLVLLVLGLWTRGATLVVLITGIFLSGALYSFKGKLDHGDTYLVAYIPAIMLFARWDSNYSINTILRRQRGETPPDPVNNSWAYVWPMRAVILLLSLMYFGAGATKLIGHWVTDMTTLSGILLDTNRLAVLNQTPPSALNLALAQIPLVMIPMQFAGILVQFLFPLNLINPRFRAFFFATMVIFHTFNLVFLNINTFDMLIAYLIVIDWQALLGRFVPRQTRLSQLSPIVLVGGSLLIAGLVTVATIQFSLLSLMQQIGLWAATPIALFVIVKSGIAILRVDILPLLTRKRTTPVHRAEQHS